MKYEKYLIVEKRDELCTSLKTGYKILSTDVHDELILLSNKIFDIYQIRDGLEKLLKISKYQINNARKFVEIIKGWSSGLTYQTDFNIMQNE